MSIRIAIDGPAGAGKSTIAKEAARRLSVIYVDTGAMYRALGLYFMRKGLDLHDEAAVSAAVPETSVTIGFEAGEQQVLLNGENVNGLIRTLEVGEAASVTSSYGAVRAHLLELQRDLARRHSVIMDGRDIGTTVLPDAELKIFLTADVRIRAKRRFDELAAKGVSTTLEQVEEEVRQRDERDMNRAVSPLRQAEDAAVVDTSVLSIGEATAVICALANERAKERGLTV